MELALNSAQKYRFCRSKVQNGIFLEIPKVLCENLIFKKNKIKYIPFTSLFDPCENRIGPCEIKLDYNENKIGLCENRIGPCENRIGPCEIKLDYNEN